MVEDEDNLIHDFENLFSPELSVYNLDLENEDTDSFEYIRYLELRL